MTESSENVALLCACRGSVSKRLSLDVICQFLERMQPSLRVVVADDLCQPRVLSRLIQEHRLKPVVVGACSKLNPKLRFWDQPTRVPLDPYSTRIVDLVKEIESPCSGAELTERVKLLLWAQVKRQASFIGVPQQAQRLQFPRPQGGISRRQLFGLLLPEYQAIPYIEPTGCVGGERCRLCQDGCAFDAVAIDDAGVLIDSLRCLGCGTCIALCPHQAVSYPCFSLDQLEGEMEGLLTVESDVLEPRIIALACQNSLSCCDDNGVNPIRHVPNILPLEIPCLAMVSSWLMLRAFDLGTQGLALLSNSGRCQIGFTPDKWQGKVRFVQELLQHWGIEPGRIRAFEVGDLEQELIQFAQDISRLPPTLLRWSPPTTVPSEGLRLPALIGGLRDRLAPMSTGAVSSGDVPFGTLELDGSQCTGCGLCTLDCPTEALVFLPGSEEDSCQLLFHHQRCVGCGQCVEVCPEGCLRLKNILELDRLDRGAEAIFEAEVVRCRECGAPIAPRAMIDRLQSRVAAAGGPTGQFEVCPACRIGAGSGIASRRTGV